MSEPVRFFLDEHFGRVVARALRQRDIDVDTVAESDRIGEPDESHLVFAAEAGRVVVTRDAGFLRFHAKGTRHVGIAYAPRSVTTRRLIESLTLIHSVFDADAMEGRLEYL